MSFQGIQIEKPEWGEPLSSLAGESDLGPRRPGFFWAGLTLSFLLSGISLALAITVFLHQ